MLYGIDETTAIDIWTHIAFRCAKTATVVDVRENVDEKNEEIVKANRKRRRCFKTSERREHSKN